MGAYMEVKLFLLIQHKLMLGMTIENYTVFVSIKKCLHWSIQPKITTCWAWARTKGEVKGGNAWFGE